AAMFTTPADDSAERQQNRRRFLRFLLGGPFLASSPLSGWQAATGSGAIADLKDALNVMDFEPAARKVLPPAHFGYLATGVDDDATVRLNHEAYSKIEIRSRRLVDVK